jgi:predicted peptidase
MPKIVPSTQFKLNIGKHLKELKTENSGYFFVANETYMDKSFFVVAPYKMKDMAEDSGDKRTSEMVDAVLSELKEKVSKKYRGIAATRKK